MQERFLSVYRVYGRLLYAFAVISGVAIFAIMWLIDLSAFSRRFLNAPIPGSVEITQSLMAFAIMLPMGYALYSHSHLRVTLLTGRLSYRVQRALYTAAMIIGFLFFAFVTWSTFQFAWRSFQIGEQVWGAMIRFPLWPAKGAIFLGALLLCIQFLLDTIRVGALGMLREADELGEAVIGEAETLDG